MWLLWRLLGAGTHPFAKSEVDEHRAALIRFMQTVPRLTAPIVEAERQAEYRVLRRTPLAVYTGRSDFGSGPR